MSPSKVIRILSLATAFLLGASRGQSCFVQSSTFGKTEGAIVDDTRILKTSVFTKDHRVAVVKLCKENNRAVGIQVRLGVPQGSTWTDLVTLNALGTTGGSASCQYMNLSPDSYIKRMTISYNQLLTRGISRIQILSSAGFYMDIGDSLDNQLSQSFGFTPENHFIGVRGMETYEISKMGVVYYSEGCDPTAEQTVVSSSSRTSSAQSSQSTSTVTSTGKQVTDISSTNQVNSSERVTESQSDSYDWRIPVVLIACLLGIVLSIALLYYCIQCYKKLQQRRLKAKESSLKRQSTKTSVTPYQGSGAVRLSRVVDTLKSEDLEGQKHTKGLDKASHDDSRATLHQRNISTSGLQVDKQAQQDKAEVGPRKMLTEEDSMYVFGNESNDQFNVAADPPQRVMDTISPLGDQIETIAHEDIDKHSASDKLEQTGLVSANMEMMTEEEQIVALKEELATRKTELRKSKDLQKQTLLLQKIKKLEQQLKIVQERKKKHDRDTQLQQKQLKQIEDLQKERELAEQNRLESERRGKEQLEKQQKEIERIKKLSEQEALKRQQSEERRTEQRLKEEELKKKQEKDREENDKRLKEQHEAEKKRLKEEQERRELEYQQQMEQLEAAKQQLVKDKEAATLEREMKLKEEFERVQKERTEQIIKEQEEQILKNNQEMERREKAMQELLAAEKAQRKELEDQQKKLKAERLSIEQKVKSQEREIELENAKREEILLKRQQEKLEKELAAQRKKDKEEWDRRQAELEAQLMEEKKLRLKQEHERLQAQSQQALKEEEAAIKRAEKQAYERKMAEYERKFQQLEQQIADQKTQKEQALKEQQQIKEHAELLELQQKERLAELQQKEALIQAKEDQLKELAAQKGTMSKATSVQLAQFERQKTQLKEEMELNRQKDKQHYEEQAKEALSKQKDLELQAQLAEDARKEALKDLEAKKQLVKQLQDEKEELQAQALKTVPSNITLDSDIKDQVRREVKQELMLKMKELDQHDQSARARMMQQLEALKQTKYDQYDNKIKNPRSQEELQLLIQNKEKARSGIEDLIDRLLQDEHAARDKSLIAKRRKLREQAEQMHATKLKQLKQDELLLRSELAARQRKNIESAVLNKVESQSYLGSQGQQSSNYSDIEPEVRFQIKQQIAQELRNQLQDLDRQDLENRKNMEQALSLKKQNKIKKLQKKVKNAKSYDAREKAINELEKAKSQIESQYNQDLDRLDKSQDAQLRDSRAFLREQSKEKKQEAFQQHRDSKKNTQGKATPAKSVDEVKYNESDSKKTQQNFVDTAPFDYNEGLEDPIDIASGIDSKELESAKADVLAAVTGTEFNTQSKERTRSNSPRMANQKIKVQPKAKKQLKKKTLTSDLEYRLMVRLLKNMQEKEAKNKLNVLDRQLMQKLKQLIKDNPKNYNKKLDALHISYDVPLGTVVKSPSKKK